MFCNSLYHYYNFWCSIMSWSEFASIAITFIVILYTYFKYKYQYWKKKNVPYIEPSFPFGSFQSSFTRTRNLTDDVAASYNRAVENNWKCIGIYIISEPSLILTDLDLVKHVLTKDFNHFTERGSFVNEKKQPISANLAAIGGTKWKNLRSKLTPTFTSAKMRTLFQTVVDCGYVLEQHIDGLCGQKGGVDMKRLLGCFSMDVIGSAAFGLQCNSFKNQDSEFETIAKKVFHLSRLRAFKRLIEENLPNFARAIGLVKFPKDVGYFFDRFVRETVDYREKNNVQRKDFLQLLIDLKKNDVDKGHTGDGVSLTIEEIAAQCFIFFVGGFETTASALSFAMYELSRNQSLQDRTREEIHRVLKKYNGKITYESIKEMEYLQQVIDETLRMHPPTPMIARVCTENYKVPGSHFTIDKDTRIVIPIKGIHYDENIYPDPKVFDPERFTPAQKNSRHPYSHIPFGEGPRICIGQRFALMETKIGIISVLNKHKIMLNPKMGTNLKMDPSPNVAVPVGGIWLDIIKV